MEEKKKRTLNFTQDEKKILTDLVLKHQSVIENKRTDAVTNAQKLLGWSKLADEFNNISSQNFRTPNSLKTCWENIKRQKKKEAAHRKRDFFMTGGGKPPSSPSKQDVIVDAILGPALEGIENVFDSDAVDTNANDKENEPNQKKSCMFEPDTDVEISIPSCSNVMQEKVNVCPELFCRIEQTINVTWQDWTPSSLRQPVTSALKAEPQLKSNWLKRRRPQTESLSDQLIKEKIQLVQTLIKNAKEEAERKNLILDEQLLQEKMKTQKLIQELNKE